MLRAEKIVHTFLFLEGLLVACPATAQYLTKLEIGRDQQVVFFDVPTSLIDETIFLGLVDRHEKLFYSTFENGTPVLLGTGGPFFEATSTIFVMDQAAAISGGCLPINEQQTERLRFEIEAQLRIEADLIPHAPNLKAAVENSWCQPVFDIPMSKSNKAIVFRLDAPSDYDMSACVAHFNDYIVLKK